MLSKYGNAHVDVSELKKWLDYTILYFASVKEFQSSDKFNRLMRLLLIGVHEEIFSKECMDQHVTFVSTFINTGIKYIQR